MAETFSSSESAHFYPQTVNQAVKTNYTKIKATQLSFSSNHFERNSVPRVAGAFPWPLQNVQMSVTVLCCFCKACISSSYETCASDTLPQRKQTGVNLTSHGHVTCQLPPNDEIFSTVVFIRQKTFTAKIIAVLDDFISSTLTPTINFESE